MDIDVEPPKISNSWILPSLLPKTTFDLSNTKAQSSGVTLRHRVKLAAPGVIIAATRSKETAMTQDQKSADYLWGAIYYTEASDILKGVLGG